MEGLAKHYGRVHALEDVTLDVRQGEIFGFLGPNGAGKSTLIRLLLGYLHPTAGRGSVLGLDIVRDSVAIRRRSGYLPGGIALDDGLSGLRLLDDLAALSGRPPVRRAAICEKLELTDRVLRRPIRDYSRGMRQKIGIVQALQHDPELAILDEPSEGLDPLMQRAFYEVLEGVRAAGRTVFFSSHVLSEVERVCDRVAIVRAGRLVALEDVAVIRAQRRRRVELRPDRWRQPCLHPGRQGRRGGGGNGSRRRYRGAVVSGVISLPLLRRTWRAQRVRVALVCAALATWGFLMPVIYATFGRQLASLLDTDIIPKPFLRLLGADPFSLVGAVALGWVHPIAIGLFVLFPIGLGAAAIAGERQRGTLEVVLSRPISRRTLFSTHLVLLVGIAVLTVLAALAGTVAGSMAYGVTSEIDAGALMVLAVNTVLLLAALAAVTLAASASFDRLAAPVGIGIALLLLGYVLEILGTLWPDAAFLQPFSPFHYLRPLKVLGGNGDPADLAVLAAVAAIATAYGLWRFPRRDLAAPT